MNFKLKIAIFFLISPCLAFTQEENTTTTSLELNSKTSSPKNTENISYCARLENAVGEVEVLDPSRSKLIPLESRGILPCGSWVAVKRGFVQLKHLSGPRIHIAEHSFLQVPEYRKSTTSTQDTQRDHIVLYRGQLYVSVRDAEEDFILRSAMARGRVRRGGKSLFLVDSETQEAQLVVLKNIATLENVFEGSRRVRLETGESSSMNLQLKRVVPSFPKIVDLASLKPKLFDLRLSDRDRTEILQATNSRITRPWIADSKNQDSPIEKLPLEKHTAARKIASIQSRKPEDYTIDPIDDGLSKRLNAHLMNRISGGSESQNLAPLAVQLTGDSPQLEQLKALEQDQSNKTSVRNPASINRAEKDKLLERLSALADDALF